MTSTRPVALITGASGGIGLELARLCAKGGHDVILVARNAAKLEEIAKYLSRDVQRPRRGDRRRPGRSRGAAGVIERWQRRGLGVDVLINNAGFGDWGLFGRAGPRDVSSPWSRSTSSRLTQLTRLVLPGMVTSGRGGFSTSRRRRPSQPGPLMAVYYATKAYVISFSEAIGNELRGTGITVTALCPGPTRTEFARRSANGAAELSRYGPIVMPVEPVAEAGYRGMMRGRTIVVPGLRQQAAGLQHPARCRRSDDTTAIARRIPGRTEERA